MVEDINHGMLDAAAGGGRFRLNAEMRQKRPCRAEMGGNHGVAANLLVPGTDAEKELLVALSAGWHETPGILRAPCQGLGLARLQLREIEPVPVAEGHFDQARIDTVIHRV